MKNVLFNDACNTIDLQLYGVGYIKRMCSSENNKDKFREVFEKTVLTLSYNHNIWAVSQFRYQKHILAFNTTVLDGLEYFGMHRLLYFHLMLKKLMLSYLYSL